MDKKKRRKEKLKKGKTKWGRGWDMCVATLSLSWPCSFNFDSISRRGDGKRDAEVKKNSRHGCIDVDEWTKGTSVGALFGRDKCHSRAMTVTKPRNYYFRYGCVSPFERVTVRSQFAGPETWRFSIVSYSRWTRKKFEISRVDAVLLV